MKTIMMIVAVLVMNIVLTACNQKPSVEEEMKMADEALAKELAYSREKRGIK